MKIFTTENDIEKAYIQYYDLEFLKKIEAKIPSTNYLDYHFKHNIDNSFDFVEFNKPAQLAYFKKQDFIIDYTEYEKFNLDELMRITIELEELNNKLSDDLYLMGDATTNEKAKVQIEKEKMMFKYAFVEYLYHKKDEGEIIETPLTKVKKIN